MIFRVQVTSLWTDNAENIFNKHPAIKGKYKIEDNCNGQPIIEISSLEELIDLANCLNEPLILFPKDEELLVMEIYDDWRE